MEGTSGSQLQQQQQAQQPQQLLLLQNHRQEQQQQHEGPAAAAAPRQLQQQLAARQDSALGRVQAVEALNTAFCRRIYSTALQHLRAQFEAADLQQQFLDILDQDDPYNQPCSVAHSDANSAKNRYRDVVPYDHNRVCLPQHHQQQQHSAPAAAAATAGGGALGATAQAAPALALPAAAAAAAAFKATPPCVLSSSVHSFSCSSSSSSSAAKGAAASVASKPSASNASASAGAYINASFMGDPALRGDQAALQGYIATQGPLPSTVADFWAMVASTNTSAIVMLTGLCDGSPTLGNSRPRCAAYFPEAEADVLRLPGGARVTCVHKNSLDDNVHFRQLEVVWPEPPSGAAAATAAAAQQQPHLQQLHQQPQQPQRLWINHYEYAGWPDYGVPPSTGSVLALCHALDGCRRAGCKLAVHCSAGVGRTGTFIAVDILLQRLHALSLQLHGAVSAADITAAMDVRGLVVALRRQRRGTVQTSEQYGFVWQALMDELASLLQQQEQQEAEQQQ
jgi:tyrosine-protein phosphatase non-receptor type 9